MDFRKVWEAWEIKELAGRIGVKKLDTKADWYNKGLVDGDNSGSAAFDWAALPGATVKQIMERVSLPLADEFYFPGGGNSVTFMTPSGVEGIAARMAYGSDSGLFSMIWDEAHTTEVPEELGRAMCDLTEPVVLRITPSRIRVARVIWTWSAWSTHRFASTSRRSRARTAWTV